MWKKEKVEAVYNRYMNKKALQCLQLLKRKKLLENKK